MPYTWLPGKPKKKEDTFDKLMSPLKDILPHITPLVSGCNQPLKMTFEDQLNILVFFHMEEHHSGRQLVQVLKEDLFAMNNVAPKDGIEKSSFFEDIGFAKVWSK